MKPTIEINNLTHRFGEKTVLNNISFDVQPGEIFGLLGPSGAGKTTISKAIFQATNSDRYVNVPNSTSASMQNALTEANSGVVLYDDIPHAGYDKCSSENKDKLELLIRSVGDMGAERRTARKSNSRPFPKRAMTAVTSEAPFFISDSSTLRCLFINMIDLQYKCNTWKK